MQAPDSTPVLVGSLVDTSTWPMAMVMRWQRLGWLARVDDEAADQVVADLRAGRMPPLHRTSLTVAGAARLMRWMHKIPAPQADPVIPQAPRPPDPPPPPPAAAAPPRRWGKKAKDG